MEEQLSTRTVLPARDGIMPLRLIDVRATIAHRASGGLSFTRQPCWHVISHTWSADVRQFSITIGELAAAKSATSYEALFETAGFRSHPAYLQLIEFLMILHAEHVKWVWLDAVCINQKDSKEKDREIQHMGTYYQSSLGCYVVHHGFGKGFKLLLDDAFHEQMQGSSSSIVDLLPRWYSRAWTFQEWVLPPKVTFTIDLASEQMLRKTAVIALLRHRKHLDHPVVFVVICHGCLFCLGFFGNASTWKPPDYVILHGSGDYAICHGSGSSILLLGNALG